MDMNVDNKSTVPQLKCFLKKRGINTSVHPRAVLLRLALLAIELQLPDIYEGDENNEIVSKHKEDLDKIQMWTDDLKTMPEIQMADVFIYLLQNCMWTQNRLKGFKNDDGYLMFVDKHISMVRLGVHDDNNLHVFIIGKCTRQQAQNSDPYDVWCSLSMSGNVDSAGCNCVASDDGTCKHVVALLFSLSSFTERHQDRNTEVATDQKCMWDQPKKTCCPSRIEHLDIRLKNRDQVLAEPTAENYNPINLSDGTFLSIRNKYVQTLKSSVNNCLILKMLEKKNTSRILTIPELIQIYKNDLCDLSFEDLLEQKLTICDLERIKLFPQKSNEWKEQRQGRITASIVGRIYKCKNVTASIVQDILGTNNFQGNVHTEYGVQNEPVARGLYVEKMHANGHKSLVVSESGLCVYKKCFYLATSPDGLVECNCCGSGLLEIKCISSRRGMEPFKIAEDQSYTDIIYNSDDKISVKTSSKWFYQVQFAMGTLGLNWCDFVIFTDKGIHIERILFQQKLFYDMVEKCKKVFSVILNEQ